MPRNSLIKGKIVPFDSGPVLPVWGTVKTVGSLYGFSRSRIFRLIAEGHFRTALFKNPGSTGKKSIRLIELATVDAFIRKHSTEPKEE
jgi:predicted DNA-binding transcriptional regulator AlpA